MLNLYKIREKKYVMTFSRLLTSCYYGHYVRQTENDNIYPEVCFWKFTGPAEAQSHNLKLTNLGIALQVTLL